MAQGADKPHGKSGRTAKAGRTAAKSQVAAKAGRPDENGRVEVHGSQNMTDLEFLRGLIDAVDSSGVDSLEIKRAGTRIRIAKTPAAAPMQAAAYPTYSVPAPTAPAAAPAAPPPAAAAAPTGGAAPATDAPPAADSHLIDVKSPMVGTFYRAPAPEAPPYIEIGTSVTRGQTLCILEAMKLMNELECEQEGIIREILVEDADPVEYGQVLFRIEPS